MADERGFHPVEKKIIDWLMDRWTDTVCPVCGHTNEWNISGPAWLPSYGTGVGPGARHFPVIPIACTYCGYTRLLNAFIMQLTREELVEWEGMVDEAAARRLPNRP